MGSIMRRPSFLSTLSAALLALGCSDAIDETGAPPGPAPACAVRPEAGDPVGHADPFGAKVAAQARAGRLTSVADLAQPASPRARIRAGDYALVNEHVAAFIGQAGPSDGYGPFGGEILALDRVGDDGKPLGLSRYGETLVGVGMQIPEVDSVSVVSDGSDGDAAVVRVAGKARYIPFIEKAIASIFPFFELDLAIDYVLEPGSERVVIRQHAVNATPDAADLGVDTAGSFELYGFFQGNQLKRATPEAGFADTSAPAAWVGYVGAELGFAWRALQGDLEPGIDEAGFSLYFGPGYKVEGCSVFTSDRAEVIPGGPELDGLREAVRRATGEPAWRAVTGKVVDAQGAAVGDAYVHLLDADDRYLSRTKSGADGTFTVHAPPDEAVRLVAQKRGYEHDGVDLGPTAARATLAMLPHGVLHVVATDAATGGRLPVRIQVIPAKTPPATPEAWGVLDEVDGRLHQEFAVTGEATLVVPPGEHRVVVSRGYEWELADETVTVAASETVELPVALLHSVGSTGVMCGDFHIHSHLSTDSTDPVEHKVKGAVVDGLEIPCSSEHEWVLDFGPVVQGLGLGAWAFGMSSSELTTFEFGHFGVIPFTPRPERINSGAIDWVGLPPAGVFGKVRALEEKPALVVNHPRSQGFGGYFTSVQLDPATVTALGTDYSDDFDALESFNGSDFEANRDAIVADWFGFLNNGKRVVSIGNSDSHHLRTSPVGYPRTCFWFGHDDPKKLDATTVRDAVLSGNSVVSGGLMMTVLGPSGERPGATIRSSGAVALDVVVEGPSWVEADTLEVIVDGKTEAVLPLALAGGGGPSNRYAVTHTVKAGARWVVFHAKGVGDLAPLHPGKRPFAVSNPIFIAP
jgi:hypothetical protein